MLPDHAGAAVRRCGGTGFGASFNYRAMLESWPPLLPKSLYASLLPSTPVFCGYIPRRIDARDGAHNG